MSQAAGSRLGPYEILAKLGEGGMGDVYKAKDTRLDRTVAVKIVRTDFSERFEREAKSISALNHPNICTLHDVGNQDGTAYLVMEFVDGAPIAGPLPIADVLKYGRQICEALEAAHKKSIVHRDLKPANILATRSGIKLLDFGLAKLQPGRANAPGNEATVAALTGAHTIVGTPQYMAPEQIEGHDADARTDIFALGCVLYELITGKRAFEGKTPSNIMAAILATEPRKITELAPVTPASLEWVVARCLEKDPDARWQSARDVALQLEWIADHPSEAAIASAGSTATPRRGVLIGLAAGVAIAAAAWFWTSSRSSGSATTSSTPLSLSVVLPPGVSLLTSGAQRDIALSPDGRAIAFAGLIENRSAIFLRSLDHFDAVKIAGTEGAEGPFFSPDGQWIGFWSDGELRKIPIGGGAAVSICDAAGLRGSVWLADNTIVFSPSPTGPLMRVLAEGGSSPTALTKLDPSKGEKTHRTLIGLPGGKAVVFVVGSNEIGTYDESRIVALTLETGQIAELVKGGYAPAYSPTGHLLFVRQGTVFALSFDAATLKTTGSPVQVVNDIANQPHYGIASFDVGPTGALIYAPGGVQTERNALQFVDRKGTITPSGAPDGHYFALDMARDGKRLAVGVGGANNIQAAYDIERKQFTRLTSRLDVEQGIWTGDGLGITYWSGIDLRTVAADGSGTEQILIPAEQAAGRSIFPESWSDDSQTLSVTVATPGKGVDIALYSRDKGLRSIVETRFDEYGGRLSPDGKWLAFVSRESGIGQIFVRAVDGAGGRVPVSTDDADPVRWTKGGRELLYGTKKGVFAVSFTPGAKPAIGSPVLVIANEGELTKIRGLDPAPDGSWFAILLNKPRPPLTEIRLITNWTASPARPR